MNLEVNRRSFLGAGAVGLGYFFTATAASAQRTGRKPNETLQFAGIGIGGKGSSDIDNVGKLGEVVALCDIDEGTLGKKGEKFSSAKTYHDFRKLYDEMGKHIDAVSVSTPDHSHALAALIGIRLGKHVYCQKPLAHSVFECRVLKEAARQYGVCTQMGNQGSTENGLRRAVELIQGGILGDVSEVHVWTNRPIWPQAPGITARPDTADVWPDSIHWDEFLAGARRCVRSCKTTVSRALTSRTSISRSSGAVGWTSAPAPSETWPATPPTWPSAPSSSRTRQPSRPRAAT